MTNLALAIALAARARIFPEAYNRLIDLQLDIQSKGKRRAVLVGSGLTRGNWAEITASIVLAFDLTLVPNKYGYVRLPSSEASKGRRGMRAFFNTRRYYARIGGQGD